VPNDIPVHPTRGSSNERGFTILELLVSMVILMAISGFMLQGVVDMNQLNHEQSNRAEMHAGIRNATALLQQEVGQAGRVAFPNPVSLAAAVTGSASPAWATLTSATGMFVGMRLVIGHGNTQEIVELTGVNASSNQIRAVFGVSHAVGARVDAAGGFGSGVIPTTHPNGSTANVLKIVGDINGDGNLVYVEYTCSLAENRLYRNMMPFDTAVKPAVTVEQVLLDNLLANPPDPGGTVRPCFSYQEHTISGRTYVVNVAIMTTVRTHDRHRITGEFQVVTKALLNVAPRNVFHTWQMASLGYVDRIQPLPPSVESLLP
jgi:prepilin-type N-terminal cleavage/methylation domain-containing protein